MDVLWMYFYVWMYYGFLLCMDVFFLLYWNIMDVFSEAHNSVRCMIMAVFFFFVFQDIEKCIKIFTKNPLKIYTKNASETDLSLFVSLLFFSLSWSLSPLFLSLLISLCLSSLSEMRDLCLWERRDRERSREGWKRGRERAGVERELTWRQRRRR